MTRIVRVLSCSAVLWCAGVLPTQAQSYHVAKSLTLGGEGGWDYLTFDSTGHRLFVTHQTRVLVVNPDNGTVLGEIAGLNGAHGVALAYGAGHGFATSGRDSTVTMFDLATYQVLGRTTVAEDDDAILYDPATQHIFTFNGDAGSSTVLDAKSGQTVGTIDLGGKPEFGVSAGDGKLYVNLEDKAVIAEIDAAAMRVTRQWPIAPCESPTGLAIDRAHHRLFSGCRNKVMAISDATAGRLITTLPIGEGVDGCAFDPTAQLAFSSNGDGTLTVIHEDSPDQFRVVTTADTRRGARTLALDERTHRIFTVTADFGPPPAPTAERPHPRPSIVAGTFALLELDP
jgi:DNA-binding beta-propeller fold protein YncE